jgi:hypothetical protein
MANAVVPTTRIAGLGESWREKPQTKLLRLSTCTAYYIISNVSFAVMNAAATIYIYPHMDVAQRALQYWGCWYQDFSASVALHWI